MALPSPRHQHVVRYILTAMVGTVPGRRVSAYYWAPLRDFIAADHSSILGALAAAHPHALEVEQRQAWEQEIDLLQKAFENLDGAVFLEFDVPRLGSRIDAVLISGPAIFPIEFKCGERNYHTADYNQAWDYALDLKNFHSASHAAPIFPVLVATEAATSDPEWATPHPDAVRPPRRCNAADLSKTLRDGLRLVEGLPVEPVAWGTAPYQPTPTIIEAARALYSKHSVEAISRHDAGAKNLRTTSIAVDEVIDRSRLRGDKAIVFVTGVPGAGKTLVGLNVATQRRESGDARAVYLSGNGPLVAVLREALTRDELARGSKGLRKGTILQKIKPFIQNIHHFRDEGIRHPDAPYDHVVIFDEAQRAWNRAQTANFMKRRKGLADFSQSEPEFLISYLDRHDDWAVIICLVGGGQEINTGEAGIAEWLNAIGTSFPKWHVYVSPELRDAEYAAESTLATLNPEVTVTRDDRLHLSTSMRSFRSEKVSAFVKAVLDHEPDAARTLLKDISSRYPLAITRDLARAKDWVRQHARGSEQFGLVASSSAHRLKPHSIDIRFEVNPIHWFLNDRHDTRSCYYLEDAATEFQIQGLELDWICVNWDADLRLAGTRWSHHSFRGDGWQNVNKPERKQFLVNAYRVLLTRARQGMIIFVPNGDKSDPTREPRFYDETYSYLAGLGIPQA